MKRYLFALLALLGSVAVASAQGLTTMTVLDSTGTTKTYRVVQDASNRLSYTHVICDPTVGANAAANCATVTSGALSVADAAVLAAINASIPAGNATIGNTVPAPTSSSALAITKVVCGSAASSCVLKASAGNLYGAYAQCTAACWLMLFNSTSAPSNGATTAGIASGNLVECVDISAASGKSITYPIFPAAFSVGITAAISSTACGTLTLSTVGFVSGSVM